MMELTETSADGAALRIRVSGRLTHEDYQAMIPRIEAAIAAKGKVSLMVEMGDVEGMEARAMLDDFAFDIRHINDFLRIAAVGDRDWQERMIKLTNYLTPADMRYFGVAQADEAWHWVRNG